MSEFDVDFEESVLAACTRDAAYLKECVGLLGPHVWSTKFHVWFWRQQADTWSKHAEKLTPRLALAAAKRDFPDAEDRVPYVELASKLFTMEAEAPRAALEQLRGFLDFVQLQAGMEAASTFLEKGDLAKARQELRKLSVASTQKSVKRLKWIEEFPDRQAERKHRREHPELYVCVPTGIRTLDAVIVGLQLGELGIVAATTGRGKSITLTHFVFHAVIREFKSLYVSLEMPARQVAQRFDSRFTGHLYKKFKTYDFTSAELREIEERVASARERFAKRLTIISAPIGTMDVTALRDEVKRVEDEDGEKVKLVALDSADHLRSLQHYNDKRHAHTEVYESVAAMAEEEERAIWSSVHVGREWAERIATAESVAEAYDKARIASLMVTLNAPTKLRKHAAARVLVDDDDEPGVKRVKPPPPPTRSDSSITRWTMYLAKYRDGESHLHVPLDADLPRILIKEGVTEEEGEGD